MKRLIYTFLFILLFIQETIIALFVRDLFIRPYGGDIIVEWLIYCFIRIFYPRKFKLLPLFIFMLSVFIEVSQYFKLIELLGLSNNKLACTVLGTSFAWADIVCYAVGCFCIVMGQKLVKKRRILDGDN